MSKELKFTHKHSNRVLICMGQELTELRNRQQQYSQTQYPAVNNRQDSSAEDQEGSRRLEQCCESPSADRPLWSDPANSIRVFVPGAESTVSERSLVSLHKRKRVEITQSMFSNHNKMIFDINNKKTEKLTNTQKLNNILKIYVLE